MQHYQHFLVRDGNEQRVQVWQNIKVSNVLSVGCCVLFPDEYGGVGFFSEKSL